MHRRSVLAALGIGAAGGLAGCLERDLSTTPLQSPTTFDRCPRWRIQVETLPEAARNEVETAIETDAYEATPPLYLPNVLDPEASYLYTADPLTYYRAQTDHGGEQIRLTVDRTVPTKGTHPLTVANTTDQRIAGTVTVEARDLAVDYAPVETPTQVLEESITVAPGTSVETSPFKRRYGSYEVTVSADSQPRTDSYSERPINDGAVGTIQLTPDNGGFDLSVTSPPVRDDIVCDRWWYGDMPQ